MSTLLRCPFCGGEAALTGRKKIKAECLQCGAKSPAFGFKSEAVAFWNSRVTAEGATNHILEDIEK